MTFGAGLCASVTFGSCSVTVLARYIFLQFEFLLYALGYLLEAELDLDAEIRATEATRLLAATTATEASESAKASMATEDVAKHREDVVHRHALSAISATGSAAHAGMAKLVVASALVVVAQYLVGFGCLLELILGLLVARVLVG